MGRYGREGGAVSVAPSAVAAVALPPGPEAAGSPRPSSGARPAAPG